MAPSASTGRLLKMSANVGIPLSCYPIGSCSVPNASHARATPFALPGLSRSREKPGCFVILRESKALLESALEWRFSASFSIAIEPVHRVRTPLARAFFAEVRDFEEEQSLVERR